MRPAPMQPATHFVDTHSGMQFEWPDGKLLRCRRCLRLRRCKNLVVQCYYDATYVWCADKDTCKRFIATKARQARKARKVRR